MPALSRLSVAASSGLVREMDSLERPALLGTATAMDSTPVDVDALITILVFVYRGSQRAPRFS
jgi:hypothetical protein